MTVTHTSSGSTLLFATCHRPNLLLLIMVVTRVSAISESLQNIAGQFLRVDRFELKGTSFLADTF